jgi:protein-S-isoprenylcysteine O-methyltransferase Ste14
MSKIIILSCWSTHFSYWALAAFSVKPAQQKAGHAALFGFRLFQIFSFVMLGGIIPFSPFNVRLWSSLPIMNVSGATICVAGTIVSIWARRMLAGNWSASVTYKEKHELVTKGPYRFVRHPIYSGLTLMMLGTVLVLGRLDSLCGFVMRFISYFFKIRKEETLLLEHFPEEYSRYRACTGSLVPILKKETELRPP